MTHASVFSGIGGPEIAATMLGWDNVFHCEINPFGRKILDYWYPNAKSYEDITKTDFTEWRGKVNVLTGGFPCQPFSYAGQRRGAEDDRYLWPYMFRCIDQIRPDWVVAENVAGITTMVEQGEVSEMGGQATIFEEVDGLHRYQLRETFTLQRICYDLESHGYSVQPVLVPACAVGAPHRRDRVFIVARRVTADTSDVGRRERRCEESQRQEDRDTLGIFADIEGHGKKRPTTDTSCECGERLRPEQSETLRTQQKEFRRGGGEDGGYITVGTRWRNFPSVSPVHRGNDGIPFDVDSLSIPFSKWRTESLKAYGNAIVPQVMYEIFRVIDLIETNKRIEAANK